MASLNNGNSRIDIGIKLYLQRFLLWFQKQRINKRETKRDKGNKEWVDTATCCQISMAVRCSLGGHCKTCHIRTFLVQDFIWFDCKTCLNECKPKSSFLLSIIISTINVNLCDRNWNKIGFIGHTFIYCGTFSSYEPVHFYIVHFKRDGQKETYKMSRFDLWATVVGKMSIDILPESYGVFKYDMRQSQC